MTDLRFLTAGESHGPSVTVVLEGLPAGLPLDEQVINQDLIRRQKGFGGGERMKIEKDRCRILGGVMSGRTIGSPLAVLIDNRDHIKWQGQPVAARTVPRPGHVDLAAALKYGYSDLRPGLERASARETAARVVVGAVCKHFLSQFGIRVGGFVRRIGAVAADFSALAEEDWASAAEANDIHCPDPKAALAMHKAICDAMQDGETLGGEIEVLARGLPAGLGSHVHWDRKLDGLLAQAVMSIPAVKGVEIGPAFRNSHLPGTMVHDGFYLDEGQLRRSGNAAGGVEGGLSNGETLSVRAAMKPIPTTIKPQASVDLVEGVETEMVYERSDVCPVPRAVVVVEAMAAFVLARALLNKLGGDILSVMQERFSQLPGLDLADMHISSDQKGWW